MMAGLGTVAVVGLLLSAQGCAGRATSASAIVQPSDRITLAAAREVFESYVTTSDVAEASSDELLALSLVTDGQQPLVAAQFRTAIYVGVPLLRYQYGQPSIYVPRLTTFPLWFVAVTPRRPTGGGPSATTMMVFDRPSLQAAWRLSISALLNPGAPAPRVALDGSGYATALASYDQSLMASPQAVGPLQATVADDGSASQAAKIVAAGPQTTGLHATIHAAGTQAKALGYIYQAEVEGTDFPEFALRTSDGGALVLYAMAENVLITQPPPPIPGVLATPIQIPYGFSALLPPHQALIRHTLTTTAVQQYAAVVPPARVTGRKIQVIAFAGGPTMASGH